MKIADFRVQTTVPSTPSVGVVGTYANPSGILTIVNENGTTYTVGQQWSGTSTLSSIVGTAWATGVLTGAAYFLPVVGPSGILLGIPAWRRV